MKRIGRLWNTLTSDDNLRIAIREVNRTHHWKPGHRPNACTAWVEETEPERIAELREVLTGGFVPKLPRVSRRYDRNAKKWRTICEPIQWPDQYVHHALVQVIQPVMMRGMDRFCCGSIRGRGTHYAARAIKRWMKDDRQTKYCLAGDIRHFYDSLTPETVMQRMKQLVKDRQVLDLIERVVSGGVLIGAYTSQWFANTVLQPMDAMIRQSGLCAHYVRYMDNLTIFGPNKRKVHRLRKLIERWLNNHGMKLKDDWQIFRVNRDEPKGPLPPGRNGVSRPKGRLPSAVGYRYGRVFTLPHKHVLLTMKRELAKYRKKRENGEQIPIRLAGGLVSRLGQLQHCNNYSLYRMLLRGEKILKELKNIIREAQKEEALTWNMFLEQRRTWKSSKPRAGSIPT